MTSSTHNGMSAKNVFGVVAFGLITICVGLIIFRMAVPSGQQIRERQVSAALTLCQQKIISLAEYGDAETPPFTRNFGKGDEFYFAWPTGSFHFKNGFGASLKMSASCIGDISTGEVKQLTLNGKSIL